MTALRCIDKPDPLAQNCPSRDMLDLIGDRWSLLIMLVVGQGTHRNGELKRRVGGISQKMLTQTLRQMERDGLVERTVHPVIPPRVDYRLTDLGLSLGEAFCGVWTWAEANLERIETARARFDARKAEATVSAR